MLRRVHVALGYSLLASVTGVTRFEMASVLTAHLGASCLCGTVKNLRKADLVELGRPWTE